MNKILLIMFSFLIVSESAFSADDINSGEGKEQISDFDQRHSLMPVEVKTIEKNDNSYTESLPGLEKKVENNSVGNTDIIQNQAFPKPEQKIIVKEEVKPVFVVPPAFPEEDKKAITEVKAEVKENLKQPVVDDIDDEDDDVKIESKKEEKSEKTDEAKEENKNIQDVKNEPFVLKQVPEKKYDGTDIIFSNVIEEKAGSVENYPLIINKPKKDETSVPVVKKEKSDLIIPDVKPQVEMKPLMVDESKMDTKPLIISAPKPNVETEHVVLESQSQKPQNVIVKDVLTAHIASYTTEESANKGIKIWMEKYPMIALLTPSVRYENVQGKGMFYRVYLTGDEAKVENLCNQMKSNKDWCNIIR